MNEEEKGQIPKIIHYIWVGPAELTPLAKRCIESWKKYLPDYEIKFWNETNSPMHHHYVQEMYKQKKWAFVSDYIRFYVLEREGGIYLDTDTEVLKSFNPLLSHQAFFGKTKDGITAAGVIGAMSHQSVIKDILTEYDNDREYTIKRTSPLTITKVLENKDYPDAFVYEYPYFNPCNDGESCPAKKLLLAYTNNHWAESWVKFAKLRKLLRRMGIMGVLKFFYASKT